ncbi:MAG TPA: hypothetical protein VLB12_06095 [Gemmatimonadales bacterium]|nr:hypothetical protein [Gemmatimonadales bacterium]
MTEPYYTILRALHMGGAWLAFAVAPVVLLARKGGHRHIIYGRCFLVAFTVGIFAGLLLAAIRSEPVIGLLLFGLVTLFFLGTGYLAPRIRQGSRVGFPLDRALTVLGALASIGMITEGLQVATLTAPLPSDLTFGLFGLAIAGGHATWRGASDPSRWRVEHLTSLLAAYTVSWHFILLQYAEAVPEAARGAVPILGLPIILWVRKQVGQVTTGSEPQPATLSGAI